MASNKINWQVVGRIFAATLPAYVLTNSAMIFIGFLLPMSKFDSVYTVSLAGFAFYTAIIMWIFHVESMKKLWLSLLFAITFTSIASLVLYRLEAM